MGKVVDAGLRRQDGKALTGETILAPAAVNRAQAWGRSENLPTPDQPASCFVGSTVTPTKAA